ncbi:hypothetical protein Btru_021696 [Bulinus truncatus]|nr:hypothetical protein Btru_021696 [Bulinus truncatus]
MSSKFDRQKLFGKSSNGEETTKVAKAADLDRLRKSIAKRSLDVKFDLSDTDYKPIENIGIGAYGVVCSAIHKKSSDRVAIKKIPNVFEALTIAKRTYREIKILKHFKHDNIICIREIMLPKEDAKEFKDIYVVFDLMESDLHRIIYSEQELSEEHIRYFLYQILRGLKYIHSANVIHRDLKPSNLLVNEDCHLRIGDFGMARGVCYTPHEPSYYMTQYVATRWYRAPEILLSMLEYGEAADMWSVGCIFAEMIGRKHLFPGKDYITQVKLIIGVLGTPSEEIMSNCQNEILKNIIKSCVKKEPVAWNKLFPKTTKKSLDLLSKMLVLDPANRINVEQALAHRLLSNYHDPDDEPICVPAFNFDFEKEDMDKSQLRSAIMDEIMTFHQPKQPMLSFNACLRPAPKAEETESKLEKTDGQQFSGTETFPLDVLGEDVQIQQSSAPVFKMPSNDLPRPVSKVSPVSVDIGKLQVAPSSDIEMLSAQSSDGRAMDTQLSVSQVIKVSEVKSEDQDEKDSKASAEKKGGNTISEDTKARVKQALMNATSRKQRAESQSEEPKEVKHVTAAQRQKEREEKRRKKKERALEKVKKSKDKKGNNQESTITLSTQDMELLRRWTVMQKPGQQSDSSPPHPGPAGTPPQTSSATCGKSTGADVSSEQGGAQQIFVGNKPRHILAKMTSAATLTLSTAPTLAANQLSSSTVLIPSRQISLLQTTFIPVLAIPSVVNPGKIEIKRIFQASDLTPQVCAAGMQASDSTKNLLQTAILMRNQNMAVQNVQPESTHPQLKNFSPPATTSSSQSVEFEEGVRNVLTDSRLSSCPVVPPSDQFAASPMGQVVVGSRELSKEDKLSPRSQGNDLLDFLDQHLKDSPKPSTEASSSLPSKYNGNHVQDSGSAYNLGSQHESPHHMTPPPQLPFRSYSDIHSQEEQLTRSNSTPSLVRSNVHSSRGALQQSHHSQRSSVPFVSYDHSISGSFPSQSNSSMHFQPHEATKYPVKFYQAVEQPSFQDSFCQPSVGASGFSPASHVLTYGSAAPPFSDTSDFSSSQSDHHLTDQHQLNQHSLEQPIHPDQMRHQQHGTDQNHQYQSQILQQQHQVYSNTNSFTEYQNYTETPTPTSIAFTPNFGVFPTSQSQQYQAQLGQFHASASGYAESQSIQQNHQMNSSATGTFSNLVENRSSLHPGTSSSGSKLRINCSQPVCASGSDMDLLAIINKLSRSQVVDSFPPSLALTPKGTGAGYGVGMDLDTMLIDAQDTASLRPDQSPLSSSLLADWLDISGNISQADLEALAQEMSPMHVSYSDMNL